MKTQNWKILTIRDPKLRRVRTSLRLILSKVISSELNHLNKLQYLYIEKRHNNKITPSQKKRESFLNKKSIQLLQASTYSILHCSKGSRCLSIKENKLSPDIVTLSEDMVWNPLEKRWICINCYNFFYKTEAQKQFCKDMHKEKEEEERAFDKWLSEQIDNK